MRYVLLKSNSGRACDAVRRQRALLADGVRPLEDPVLPGRQAAEDLRLHRLGPDEAQVGLHAGQRVGRQRRAALDRQPHLVVPVELVGRERHEARPRAPPADRTARRARARSSTALGLAEKPRLAAASGRCSSAAARRSCPTARSCSADRDRRACTSGRRPAPARTACPAKQLPGSMSAKKLRAVRSMRFSVRLMKCMISRTSQCSWCASSTSSTASTARRIALGLERRPCRSPAR